MLVAVTEKHAFKSSLTDEESPVNEDLTTSYHIHDLFYFQPTKRRNLKDQKFCLVTIFEAQLRVYIRNSKSLRKSVLKITAA